MDDFDHELSAVEVEKPPPNLIFQHKEPSHHTGMNSGAETISHQNKRMTGRTMQSPIQHRMGRANC